MNKTSFSFVRRVLSDQSGQVLPWVTFGMVSMLGMAGLTIDVGHAYVVRSQLQGGTNAAALAAARTVYQSTTALTNEADLFASNSSDANKNSYVTGTPTVEPICVQALEANGATCTSTSAPNAVLVTQTASVPTTFLNVVGIHTMPIQTTALAALAGPANPWNIAIIEDGTGSMSATDSDCSGASQYQCALGGIQTLLTTIKSACSGAGPSCTPATSNVRIAMFMFPNVLTSPVAGVTAFNSCSGATFTEPQPYQVYTLPLAGASSYAPMTYTQGSTTWTASYEITYGASDADTNGFVSDYYNANDASTFYLNSASSLVKAIGYGGTASGSQAGCMAISPGGINLNGAQGTPGATVKVNKANVGEGITYYASVIYAAQAALTAEQTAYPGSQNAMVLLSDGQANTQWIYFPQGTLTGGTADTAQPSTISSTLGYSTLNTTASTSVVGAYYLTTPNQEATALNANTGKYPDFLDECQQAIVAGQAATAAGTTVYAVAYGSENVGCNSTGEGHPDDYTDVTLVAAGNNVAFTLTSLTPCVTMENIASTSTTFYGVQQSGTGVDASCMGATQAYTTMGSVWAGIGGNFIQARLLPSNSTYIVV
jgi:Flp pilus assembly protein TadG